MAIRFNMDVARKRAVKTWQTAHSVHAYNQVPPPAALPNNGWCNAAGPQTVAGFYARGGMRVLSIFQSLNMEIAMKTSMGITFASTGVFGIKWSTSTFKDSGTAKNVVKYFFPAVSDIKQILKDGDFVS